MKKAVIVLLFGLAMIFAFTDSLMAQGTRTANQSATASAESTTPAAFLNTNADGLAVKGYDVVAYFPEPIGQGKAVQGNSEITAKYEGATYYFASEENRDTFLESPDTYAPKYGGYCAWAVSQGYTAGIDPRAFNVHENELFLNFSLGIRRSFLSGLERNIQKAEQNWPRIKANFEK